MSLSSGEDTTIMTSTKYTRNRIDRSLDNNNTGVRGGYCERT